MTRVETRVVMLKLKYGMEVGDKVDSIIRKLIERNPENPLTADEERHRDVAEGLRLALVKAGFLPDQDEEVQEVQADDCAAATNDIKAKFKEEKKAKKLAAANGPAEKFEIYATNGEMNQAELKAFLDAERPELSEAEETQQIGLAKKYFDTQADTHDKKTIGKDDFLAWHDESLVTPGEGETDWAMIGGIVAAVGAIGVFVYFSKKN